MCDAMEQAAMFWVDQRGASASEYALILAVMGVAVVASVNLLTGAISTSFGNRGGDMPFQGQ